MRKWTDDGERAKAIESRHMTFRVGLLALSLAGILIFGIKGCTDYNIERVKHPVKYEQIDTYERGGSQ